MQADVVKAVAIILVYEGGLANVKGDPGELTNKGITQGTYNSWRMRQGLTTQSVAKITDGEVNEIYRAEYWDRVDCDDMPPGVDLCLFDAAVNSGVGSSTRWAQGVCGLDTDGDIGPKTKAAILAMDPEEFIRDFNSRRLGTLQRLPTWGEFGKGWSARIANGQKQELAWAEGGEGPDPVQVHTIGGHTKANPSLIPTSHTAQIATHAATVGGAVGTAATQTASSLTGISDTFTWMKYVLGVITLIGALAGLVVMFSKQANDAASVAARKAVVDPDADADLPTTKLVAAPVVIPVAVVGGKVG
jgi:lysozyme family protein